MFSTSFSMCKLIMFVKVLIIIVISFLNLSCDFSSRDDNNLSNERPDCSSCSILFIGSSYLSYADNNVMELFEKFAIEAKKDVYVDNRSLGGWRLVKHSQSEHTIAKINERKWDYVILQGNAAYLSKEKWHQYIVPYIKELRKIIKKNSQNTCIIYMMPWAYLDGLAWVEGETDTYEQMQLNLYNETKKLVKEIDIATAPVGWAWYTAISSGYEWGLYLSDNNHQSQNGAYLAASVFYSTIFLEMAPEISIWWREENDALELRQLADSLVKNDLDLWNIY